MKSIEKVVSENINKLLKEKNINKNDLAKIAGVSESTVGKWTLEKATPRMGAVQKISDYFNIPKSYILNEDEVKLTFSTKYPYFPVGISAGLPENIESIQNTDKIAVPDSIMGKWAGNKDICIMRVNGESMNRTIPNGSLIAVKPIPLDNIKNGDIVVYSDCHDYSVKHFYRFDDAIVFKPNSTDISFREKEYTDANISALNIFGKVVVYIVEMD